MKLLLFIATIIATNTFAYLTPKPTSRPTPKLTPKPPPTCGYESCHPVKDGYVNVHLVPHTHDDVGWLKTVDQYYFGSKDYIQEASVQNILDSVVQSLSKDPDRRFIYVETVYFWKWWMKQHDAIKHQVRNFVNRGQLEIIGGGWTMNDEADTNYQSIIDQFTWGLRKLNNTLGKCGRPKIGWQIDPFGHSREMASLFSQLGFDGVLLGRIDYQDKKTRFKSQDAEMIWKSSDSLGSSSNIFTSVLYNNYSPPPGFCWDVYCSDEPIIDDADSYAYNVKQRVEEFLDYVDGMTKVYRTNHVLVTMGQDFNYRYAEAWFQNIDKLIYYANKVERNNTKYNFIYSTPSCYVKAVHDVAVAKKIEFVAKEDDFFPYASDPHSYWTGYFTSRPTLKRYERFGNNFLQVCKQLYALADLGPEDWADLNAMREAMGVLQHHDAITGTEKQHVADDYARILDKGFAECHFAASTALGKLVTGAASDREDAPTPSIPFESCLLSNISQCSVSENLNKFVVTVYNPLSRPVNHYVRLPVPDGKYTVTDPNGESVNLDVFPIHPHVLRIPGRKSNATQEIVFEAIALPPLGFKSYYVDKVKKTNFVPITTPIQPLTNVYLDETTGLVSEVEMRGVKVPVKQEFFYYNGFVGNNSESEYRSSGAYIFRPNGTSALQYSAKATYNVYGGRMVAEIHQTFNEWTSQVIRIYADEGFVEFDWLIGPIPVDDNGGKEVISRYTTNLKSESTFYTDSNGREMLKRVRNFRPTWKLETLEPISANYYPVTSKILIQDAANDLEMAVLTDRAQGGSSLQDGAIELMVHRRCVSDDAFGVGEALNETAFGVGLVSRGSHYFVVGPYKNNSKGPTLAAQERDLAQRKLLSAWTFLAPTNQNFQEYHTSKIMQYSGLNKALPQNVQILTLEPWLGMSFLLRLEHVLGKGEDPILSKPATIDLKNLFAFFEIESYRETTLAANQWLEESNKLEFPFNADDQPFITENHILSAPVEEADRYREDEFDFVELEDADEGRSNKKPNFKIKLNPMQIRTFIIEIKKLKF